MANSNSSLRVALKIGNHKRQICIQVDRLISTKRLGSKGKTRVVYRGHEIYRISYANFVGSGIIPIDQDKLNFQAFKWNLTTETITKLENRHAVLARLKEDTQIPAT